MSENAWIKCAILLFTGIGFSCLGVLLKRITSIQKKYNKVSSGSIIDLVLEEADATGRAKGIKEYYYPVVAYYANGQLKKVKSKIGKFPTTFKVNQTVWVRYNEKKPEDCFVQEKNPLRYLQIWQICYALGILFCVVALIYLFVSQ
jgi:hypothetical protein